MRLVLLRLAAIAAGLVLWFYTQSLLGSRPTPSGEIGDTLLEWLASANAFLSSHEAWAGALLVSSSAVIDILGLFLIGSALLGASIRPFLAMILLFGLRQICQGICALPLPEGMIWRDPGFPSLLVTYGVSNDLFFSGHTSLAVLGAIELARTGRRPLAVLGALLALFEASAVLVLRAHYSMDVFTGAVAALWIDAVTARLAPRCDRALARLAGGDVSRPA